jgi:hypothetical protein
MIARAVLNYALTDAADSTRPYLLDVLARACIGNDQNLGTANTAHQRADYDDQVTSDSLTPQAQAMYDARARFAEFIVKSDAEKSKKRHKL